MAEENEVNREEIQMPENHIDHRSEKEVFPDAMIGLIRQWIPGAEKAMSEVLEDEAKKGFEVRLASIKEDFAKIEGLDWKKDDEAKKQLQEAYARMEELIGEIDLYIEERKKA
jgi:hypothetical protein